MAFLYDRVGMTVTGTPGSSTITLNAAITDAANGDYLTFAQAGVASGTVVNYLAVDGNNFELGTGAYTSSGTSLARGSIINKSSGTPGTTTPISLTSAAKIYIVPVVSALVTTAGLAQPFAGGIRPTVFDLGTVSSGTTTPDSGNGPIQKLTNNGAFTLASLANDGGVDLMITNGASAGAITFSSFTKALTGDTYATTNTNKYMVVIRRINSISFYQIQAMQ